MKKLITSTLFISITILGIAQELPPESSADKLPVIKQQPVENYRDFLYELGINNMEPSNPISKERLQKLKDFNFDRYRHISSRSKVQVLNGPLLELFSINEMEALGKAIDPQIKAAVSQKDTTGAKHEVVPQVHLGWNNKTEYYHPEIESLMHQ